MLVERLDRVLVSRSIVTVTVRPDKPRLDAEFAEREVLVCVEGDQRLRGEDQLLAASVLDMIEAYVRPGVSTEELDQRCHDFILAQGLLPPGLMKNAVDDHFIPEEKAR